MSLEATTPNPSLNTGGELKAINKSKSQYLLKQQGGFKAPPPVVKEGAGGGVKVLQNIFNYQYQV